MLAGALGDYWIYIAAGIFALAAATDFVDGRIARKRNLVTSTGNLLDTIADKILVAAALFVVLGYNLLDRLDMPVFVGVAIVTLMIAREFIVSLIKAVGAGKNIVILADKMGKLKMALQIAALLVLLVAKPIEETLQTGCIVVLYFTLTGFILLCAATILSVVSGINYIVKNRGVFSEKVTGNREQGTGNRCG